MNNLSLADFFVIILSVVILLFIAYVKGKDNKDSYDFFIAGKKIPVWAATLSFVATEISAMTIVGVPAVSFKDNWQYLQFFIGSAVSRILIAYFFIPIFYRFNCITIYDFLGKRFSEKTQFTSSIFFFITRLLASGIRLYATALAISVIMGWNLAATIFLFLFISSLFIGYGGIKSVIYTGSYQAISFYVMAVSVIGFIYFKSGSSFSDILNILNLENKLSVINFGFNLKDPNIFFIAVLNGALGSLASFGTDYEMMQRLLTLKTRKESQKSITYTIFASFILVCLYLAVGSFIYFFLKTNYIVYNGNTDKILSFFTVNYLPSGLKGLVVATILLASIDLPLSSLTTSFMNDIFLKQIKDKISEKKIIFISRIVIVFFGFLLGLIAYMSRYVEGMLWFAFEINGVTAGSLLGIFLLGMFSDVKKDSICVFSMIAASVVCLTLLILNRLNIISLGWSWLIVIGTSITFFVPIIYEKAVLKLNDL